MEGRLKPTSPVQIIPLQSFCFCSVSDQCRTSGLQMRPSLFWGVTLRRLEIIGDGVWTCWPGPLWKNVLFIRGTWWRRTAGRLSTECWEVRLQVRHPWLVFKTPLVLRNDVARGSCFVTFAVPKPVQISGLGTEPGFPSWCIHDRLLTDKRIFSRLITHLEQVVTQLNANIISAVLWLDFFTDQFHVYFYIHNLHWKYNPKWSFSIGHLQFSIHVAKYVTSQYG